MAALHQQRANAVRFGYSFREISVFRLADGRADIQGVAVGIGNGEFAESPGLIYGSGVNGGFGALGCIESARAKCVESLVDIVDEDASD